MSEVLAAAFGPGGKVVTAIAPGRVNLIGEHTDYNEGFVLPMAIEAAVEMAGRRRADQAVWVHSVSHGETVAFSLAEAIRPDPDHPWSHYVRGVLRALQQLCLRRQLDQIAQAQHRDALRDLGDDAEIVGDEQHAHVHARLELRQQ